AMVTAIRRPADPGGQRVDRIELEHLDPGLLEVVKETLRGSMRSEAVVNQIDLNAAALLRYEGVGEFLSDRVIGEYVNFNIDAVGRIADRVEHRFVRIGPVLKQGCLVPQRKRNAGYGLLKRQV